MQLKTNSNRLFKDLLKKKKKKLGTKRNVHGQDLIKKYLGLSFDDGNVKNDYWHLTDFMQHFNMFLFMESLLAFITPTYMMSQSLHTFNCPQNVCV